MIIRHAPGLEPESDQTELIRQIGALHRGEHPLSLALDTPLALHDNAAAPDSPDAPGLRCRTCRHWTADQRCALPDLPSRIALITVRGWTPACTRYRQAEPR